MKKIKHAICILNAVLVEHITSLNMYKIRKVLHFIIFDIL